MSSTQPVRRVLRSTGWLLILLLALALSIAAAPAAFAQAPLAEPDAPGACTNLRTLAVDDTLAQSLPQFTETEWVKFSVEQGARYRLEVSDAAGLQLSLHDGCRTDAPAVALRNGQLEFSATRAGDYYLLVRRNGIASAGLDGYKVTLSPAAPHRPSFTPLADVPEAVLRRATEFLEEMRGSDLTPEWTDARVNPNARILYRPDMQTPAYYEFNVEKPVDNGYEPAGFIQLAAGEHDYPVTHWEATGMSPTQQLAELAPLGTQLTEFYKVDALAYAAEYEEPTALGITTVATDVVNLGNLPGRIEGLDTVPQQAAELVTETIDDEGNLTHEGPDELPLTNQADWESWQALKDGYKDAYAPLLASLQQRANSTWQLNNNLSQYGESLVKGDVRTVHGLASFTIASIEVTGDGAAAQYLQQEQLSDNSTPTGVRLTVLGEPADKEARLAIEVKLTYTNDKTDVVKYAIVNAAALTYGQVFLPFLARSSSGDQVSAASVEAPAAPSGDWGPWSYWWTPGDGSSIRYGQFTYGGCASGCGATAWAMLFAWADRRAAINAAPYANHDGLYRVGGGYGADAVAPLNQDAGVVAMTTEIRNHIGTWCAFGSGATWPWRMIDAYKYVQPRATAAWSMGTSYDPTGLCWFGACNGARNRAIDAVTSGKPAIVGTGWLKHYPLALGYAQRSRESCFLWWCSTDYSRWFWVNQGWYGSSNGWTSADVWFGGAYYP